MLLTDINYRNTSDKKKIIETLSWHVIFPFIYYTLEKRSLGNSTVLVFWNLFNTEIGPH